MTALKRSALLLDRDGVINVDHGYVSRLQDFKWMPGIFDLARTAARWAMPIIVVTNQSGIGRGYYSEDDFQTLTAFMCERFAAEGAQIAGVYHCPYHPEAVDPKYRAPDHPWRKPKPGMILAARDEHNLELASSVLMGDRLVDLQAGAAAGVGHLVLIGAADLAATGLPPYRQFAEHSAATEWLHELMKPRG